VTSVESAAQGRRCAVIYNPTKVSDKFHALMEANLQRKGWGNTLWLETLVQDSGRAMTRQAVAEQVDLVIGAGGDGTIRYVADGLTHTGIPLGLVPAGTGNLLARNLDLPLEEVDAIEVALSGQVRQVDLVKMTGTVGDKASCPRRRRGITTAHGSLSRVGAGCNCHDYRAAGAAFQRERERRLAEGQFPKTIPASRAALLKLLEQGVPFKQAIDQTGVRAHQVWWHGPL
jgi:hypothetical protein